MVVDVEKKRNLKMVLKERKRSIKNLKTEAEIEGIGL
jgi:hypothetical protein